MAPQMKFSAASSKGRFAVFFMTPAINGFLVELAGLGAGAVVGVMGAILKA